MKIDRRAALGLALAAPFAGLPARPADAWPHPEVGKPALPENYCVGDQTHLDVPEGGALVGMWTMRDRVVSRGRIYTAEEWQRVGPDVRAFLARRKDMIDAALSHR